MVIAVGIYSLLQLELRQKLMDAVFRAVVYCVIAVEFYGGIDSFFFFFFLTKTLPLPYFALCHNAQIFNQRLFI